MNYLRPHWLWLFGLSIILSFGVLLLFLKPQLATYYTPVTLTFRSQTIDKIHLSWSENPTDRVALVPLAEKPTAEQATAAVEWCGLLPPVPIDHLTLTVQGSADFTLEQILLQTRSSLSQDMTLTANDFVPSIKDGATVTLRTRSPLGINPSASISRVLSLWLMPALVLALIVLASYRSLFGVVYPLPTSQRTTRGLRVVSRICLAITVLYVLHHEAMPAFYNDGDSNWYLWKGSQMAEEYGKFETKDSYLYELCKLPGYCFIYAFIVKLVGYNISTLMLSQHLAYCLSLYILGRALLHFASPLVVCLGLLGMALSPIQLFYCSFVMSESWMVSLTLVSIACLLELAARQGAHEWRWLLAFSITVGASSMMRSNGVFLSLALVPLYLQRLRLGEISWPKALTHAAVAGLLILAPLTAWSVRNYASRKVLGPQQMQGIMLFQGLTYGGALDPRVDAFESSYDEFSRLHAQRALPPWSLRSFLYEQGLSKNPDGQQVMAEVEANLRAIVRQSATAQPRVYAAAMLRGLNDNVWQKSAIDHINHNRNAPLSLNYFNAAQTEKSVADVKLSNSRNVYDVRGGTSWLARLFRRWNGSYLWYYRTLLVGALLAGFWSLRGKQTQSLLFVPYLLFGVNVLFYTALIMPYGRYIHVLDGLLILQMVFVASRLRVSPAPSAEFR